MAVVYSREIDGRKLTLAPSGWTYESTFVLYDKETGSLWYPFKDGLKSIQGAYFERTLKKLPSEDTQWKTWVKNHPETLILK